MRIQGARLRAATVCSQLVKEAQPCRHHRGAVATVTYCTDQIKEDYAGKEILGFKHNFRLHAFVTPMYNDQALLNQIYSTGLIGMGIYFQTEFWRHPVTGVIGEIPDFYRTTWTQAAVDAELVTADKIGTAKAYEYPNHGQQLYDLTGGMYGYDHTSGTPGQVDVLMPVVHYYRDWFKAKFGRYPSSASYGYGRGAPGYAMREAFAGIRNSAYTYGHTYELTRQAASSHPSSTRQNDMPAELSMTRAAVHQLCAETLDDAITAGGWYIDFTHWHSSQDTEYTEYLASQRAAIAGRDVVALDYGTAIEYQFLRRMVRRAGLYQEGDALLLMVETRDTEGLPLYAISTTLSVEVDLTGTTLAGKEISASSGLRKKAADRYVVEVPYSKRDGFQVVRLAQTTTPRYLDDSLPVVSSVTKSGNILTVSTQKPARVVVYTTATGGTLHTATAIRRGSTLATAHSFDMTGIDLAASDVYVGAISETGQAVLSQKYIL